MLWSIKIMLKRHIEKYWLKVPLEVLEQDIRSYVQAQELLDDIGANYHVPVDYIKSTPLLAKIRL